MNCGIYKIEHVPSGRIYVGSSCNIKIRLRKHRRLLKNGNHHSIKLQRAWSKYGEKEFVFSTVLICAQINLRDYEARAIGGYESYKKGFNGTDVILPATHTLSQESKERISRANTGRIPSKETIEKLRLARSGRKPALGMKHSEAARSKMSMARKGRARPPEATAAIRGARLGTKHTEKTKAMIGLASGAARLGIKRGAYRKTEGHQRLRKMHLGTTHTEETKAKISASLRKRNSTARQG